MIKVHWVRRGRGQEAMNAAGWSQANIRFQRHLGELGALDDDAPVAIHFTVPVNYWPIEGRTNVLFTMWESPWQLTDSVVPVIRERRPDAVFVPCDWCRDSLKALMPEVKVATVPLGLDPTEVTYRQRRWKPGRGVRFRWGFLGAPNFRKYSMSRELYSFLHARQEFFRARGVEFEFYWKFGGEGLTERLAAARDEMGDGVEEVEPGLYRGRGKDPDGLPGDDWVIDNRFLPRDELIALYYTFHGFLALHTGEGFGLNALEAMASGCPTLVTDYSGTTQFATARTAFPIPPLETTVRVPEGDGTVVEKRAILPDPKAIGEQAIRIMADYYPATVVAKRGAEVAGSFTWAKSAQTLCDTVADPRILGTVSTR